MFKFNDAEDQNNDIKQYKQQQHYCFEAVFGCQYLGLLSVKILTKRKKHKEELLLKTNHTLT